MRNDRYDIIIIGCGLVGGSLALTLPDDLSVAIIDAESPMQKQPGYLALNIHSCRVLKSFGIWDKLRDITAIQQIDVSEWHQPTGQLILTAEDIGAPALGYVTSTSDIREVLLQTIQQRKNITWYCPERAEDIQWPDEGLEKVAVKLSKTTLYAKLVIMADGGRSELRDKLGFSPHFLGKRQSITISRLNTYRVHQNLAFERFTSQGPIALLPVNQEEYLLVWTMDEEQQEDFMKQSEEALLSKLATLYQKPEINAWKELGPRKSYPVVCHAVTHPIKTRFVLMGNAAHTVHPVGAQGFNLSLKDAYTLSLLMQEALEKQYDMGGERLLNNYLAQRQDDTRFVLYFTQFLLNAFSHPMPLLAKIRSMGLSWINHSAYAKQWVLEKTTGKGKIPPSPPLKRGGRVENPSFLNGGQHTSKEEKYDILILGNRLIGSTLACALNSNYRIAILDRSPTPQKPEGDFQLRINAYNRASEELLRRLGVWQALPTDRCFAFDKIYATSEESGVSEHLQFYSSTINEPHIGHFIENDLVTYYLHQRLKTLPHVDFLDDVTVTRMLPSEEDIKIITSDERIFSAKLLAACDGAHSLARECLGIPVDRHPYYQRCIVGNIFFEGDLDKTAWQRFLKTGPLGLLPLCQGVCSLAWSVDKKEAERLLAMEDAEFIDTLDKAIQGRLGKITRISSRQSFPLTAQHALTYIDKRTMLLGDAAHTIHPLGGLGANLGFQDVIAAARLLNDEKVSTRDVGRRYVLEKYERHRRQHNTLVMQTMTAFNALFHQRHPRLNPLGRLSLLLANKITPAKNAMFRQAMWMGESPESLQAVVSGK